MVRFCVCSLFVILFAVPAMAQDEFPRLEMTFGYGRVGLSDLHADILDGTLSQFGLVTDSRGSHGGFTMHTGLNFTHWLGFEYMLGYYGLGKDNIGNSNELLVNIFSGKVAARQFGRVVPYAVAGIGDGSLRVESLQGGDGGVAFRYGGGVDVPLNTGMSLKFDLSRMSFGFLNVRESSTNFSVGVTINLM